MKLALTLPDELRDRVLICHGMVSGQAHLTGQRFIHAWVEFCGVALDHSNGNSVALPVERYHQIGKIDSDAVVRYTLSQAARHALVTMHSGPWDE